MGLLLRRLWGSYLRQLERRPVVVKATSSAITFSLTDALVRARANVGLMPQSPPPLSPPLFAGAAAAGVCANGQSF